MKSPQLHASQRSTTGRNVRIVREQDLVPAVMYGHGIENINLSLPAREFQTVYGAAGESTLVDLLVDAAEPVKVIIQDVQKDGVSDRILHADLYQVNMKEKITAEVPIVFVGESPAVKTLGGILIKNLAKVEVESLPADLPHELQVDISGLKLFTDKITVGNIQVPAGVTLRAEATEAVILVEEPRSEEELKALEGEVKTDVSGVEVLTEKKEDEAAAGEVAAPEEKKEGKKEEKK